MSTILSAKQSASDKGGHCVIPFFDNLPTAAIPATQHLYDQAVTPGYNPLVAYSDFISRLNSAGTDVPPRAIVKRWVAGVQAGLIVRPGPHAADMIPVSREPSYFESLPDAAMPALSQLWDEVQASTGSNDEEAEDERTFDTFFEEIHRLGHREPEWRGFVGYARAIRAGDVERPARQIAEDAVPSIGEPEQPEVIVPIDEATRLVVDVIASMPDAPTCEAATQKILTALASAPSIPLNVTSMLEFQPAPALTAVQAAAGRLLEENIVQLSREIEHTARQNTARMLRAMADELEGGAAYRNSSLRSSTAG